MTRTATAVALILLTAAAAPAKDPATPIYEKAIDWLAKQQHENGGFGQVPGEPPGEVGITGLVVTALADAPEPWRTKYKAVAEKAAKFLVERQQPDGSFTQGRSGLGTYRTAISMMALGAVDRARFKDQIAKGAEWLKGDQFDEAENVPPTSPHHGGFGYDKAGAKPDADLSNTQLALQALHDAGVPPSDPVFQRAMVFLRRCQNSSETNEGLGGLKPLDDGGFFYDPGLSRDKSAQIENPDGTKSLNSYASMTYAGLMGMVYSGLKQDDPKCKAALGWIAANYTLEENKGLGVRNPDPKAGQQGLYYYYNTFAKCLASLESATVETAQGPKRWADDLVAALAARQKPDGSWMNEHDRWWEKDPTLVTAYCLNALNKAWRFRTAE